MRSASPTIARCTVFAAVLLGLAQPSAAESDAGCVALIGRSDVYAAGRLTAPYGKALMNSGRTVAPDGAVDRVTAINGCIDGAFRELPDRGDAVSPHDAAAPFTPEQAKAVLEQDGYTAVTNLVVDGKGIWRGTAIKAGKSVEIALQPTGVIVAN